MTLASYKMCLILRNKREKEGGGGGINAYLSGEKVIISITGILLENYEEY